MIIRKMRWQLSIALFAAFVLSGCLSLPGMYRVTAVDVEGNGLVPNISLIVHGRGIYWARNSLCSLHPGTIVHIKDAATGEELKSKSPYKCRGSSKNRQK